MNLTVPKPLMELVQSVQDEIAKHKWLESKKAGRDIGMKQAFEDWLQYHFPNWARHEKNRAIEQALYAQEHGWLKP